MIEMVDHVVTSMLNYGPVPCVHGHKKLKFLRPLNDFSRRSITILASQVLICQPCNLLSFASRDLDKRRM